MTIFITPEQVYETINGASVAHMQDLVKRYSPELQRIVAATADPTKSINLIMTIFGGQVEGIVGHRPAEIPGFLSQITEPHLATKIKEFYRDHPTIEYWVDMLDFARVCGYDEESATRKWISNGWIKDGEHQRLATFETGGMPLRHMKENKTAIKYSEECVFPRSDLEVRSREDARISLTVYENKKYKRYVLDDKKRIQSNCIYIDYKCLPHLIMKMADTGRYQVAFFSEFVKLILEYNDTVNNAVMAGFFMLMQTRGRDLCQAIDDMRSSIERKIEDGNREVIEVLSNKMDITQSKLHPSCILVMIFDKHPRTGMKMKHNYAVKLHEGLHSKWDDFKRKHECSSGYLVAYEFKSIQDSKTTLIDMFNDLKLKHCKIGRGNTHTVIQTKQQFHNKVLPYLRQRSDKYESSVNRMRAPTADIPSDDQYYTCEEASEEELPTEYIVVVRPIKMLPRKKATIYFGIFDGELDREDGYETYQTQILTKTDLLKSIEEHFNFIGKFGKDDPWRTCDLTEKQHVSVIDFITEHNNW